MTIGVPNVESILQKASRPPARLTFWKISLAVFVGNALTGVVFAVYAALTR